MTQIFGGLVVLLLVGGVGGWAATTDIAGAVIGRGQVEVRSSAKKVQHLEGGIVAELTVRNGDYVDAGDLVIRLDDTETRANLAIIESQRNERLVERMRLEAERDLKETIAAPDPGSLGIPEAQLRSLVDSQQTLLTSRLNALTGKKKLLGEQIMQAKEQIGGLEAQLAAKKRQSEIIVSELESLRTLYDKELVEKTRILALERQAAMLDGDSGQIQAEIGRLRGAISETGMRIIQEEEEWRSQVLTALGEVRARLASLEEQRTAAIARLRRSAIVAPISGYVHELAVHTVGGVIRPGEPVMLIVPQGDALVVKARISPGDIDQIAVGQDVRLRFSALGQRVTPELNGQVSVVAPDVTSDVTTREVYYPVEITLAPGETEKLGAVDLRPGMPVDVFVQTGMRTALSYLTRPLTEQLEHAFRE